MIISHDVPILYKIDATGKGKRLPSPKEIKGEKNKKTAAHTNSIPLAGNAGIRCHKR